MELRRGIGAPAVYAVLVRFDAKFDREWKDGENRTTTLICIGTNLDRTVLTEGFKAGLA